MAGAAEQKAVLPPINLMKPTHQFPIQTFFLNHTRLKTHGVKPQEPNVKNSMLSACHGEKLPCTDQSTGRTLVQTKTLFLTNVTVKSNRWFFWSPCLQGDEHLLSHIALRILAWLVQQDGYCSLGKQSCFQGKAYTGVLGDCAQHLPLEQGHASLHDASQHGSFSLLHEQTPWDAED